MKTYNLNLIKMSAEEVMINDINQYNEKEWIKKVKGYEKYNPTFYMAPKNEVYNYTRFFVTYTHEGINFLGQLSYSSSLSNAGFKLVNINQENGSIEVTGIGEENVAMFPNNDAARAIMAKSSQGFGMIFTNQF